MISDGFPSILMVTKREATGLRTGILGTGMLPLLAGFSIGLNRLLENSSKLFIEPEPVSDGTSEFVRDVSLLASRTARYFCIDNCLRPSLANICNILGSDAIR